MANNRYPQGWKQIAAQVRLAALGRCERCGCREQPLSVHHVDGNKDNNVWWNLAALCRQCHVELHRRETILTHLILAGEEWFRPHMAGMLGQLVIGKTVERNEAIQNYDLYVIALLTTAGEMTTAALLMADETGDGEMVKRMRQSALSILLLVLDSGAF